jgi:hypothetical protein
MQLLMAWLYTHVGGTAANAKAFFANEVRLIKKDERGMELLQVLLIILFVVVIAAALWIFLGDFVVGLIQDILDRSPDVAPLDVPTR